MKDKSVTFRVAGFIFIVWSGMQFYYMLSASPIGHYAEVTKRLDEFLLSVQLIAAWAFLATGYYLRTGESKAQPAAEAAVDAAPATDAVMDDPPEVDYSEVKPILKWDLFHVNRVTGQRIRFSGNHELDYEVAEQRARVRREAQFNTSAHTDWTIEAYPVTDTD